MLISWKFVVTGDSKINAIVVANELILFVKSETVSHCLEKPEKIYRGRNIESNFRSREQFSRLLNSEFLGMFRLIVTLIDRQGTETPRWNFLKASQGSCFSLFNFLLSFSLTADEYSRACFSRIFSLNRGQIFVAVKRWPALADPAFPVASPDTNIFALETSNRKWFHKPFPASNIRCVGFHGENFIVRCFIVST